VDTVRKRLIPAAPTPDFGALQSAAHSFNKPIDQKGANQFHYEFENEIEQHEGCIMALVADFVKTGSL
jgi:hypothetical protein